MGQEDETDSDARICSEGVKLAREDANNTLDRAFEKHSAHQTKSVKILQLNGVVVSILLAGVSQINLTPTLISILLASVSLFFISSVCSIFGLSGDDLTIGISQSEVNVILDKVESEEQYLIWFLEEKYKPILSEVVEKTDSRSNYVEVSVWFFFGGLLLLAGGIFMIL